MSDALCRDTVAAFKAAGANKAKAAAALGIPRSTFLSRYQEALTRGFGDDAKPKPEIVLPQLPDEDMSPREIIEHAKRGFIKREAYAKAAKWFSITVKSNKPIGVAFIGDPHLDDNGTHWPLFEEHVRILEQTDGMYAVGGNDLTNNWVGRLLRLYADQDMSKKSALRLVKWLLAETDIKWLCHVLGNHDAWNDGSELYRLMAEVKGRKKSDIPVVPVFDWEARFKLVFPNKKECKIWMAHDFPGHSQWNHLHGPQKAALMRDDAHIYACAHRHCWAVHQEEHAYRDFVYWLVRSRGYKVQDKYARDHGFGSQRAGATVLAVVDPLSEQETGLVHCFADLAEGAEFLEWKRSRV